MFVYLLKPLIKEIASIFIIVVNICFIPPRRQQPKVSFSK